VDHNYSVGLFWSTRRRTGCDDDQHYRNDKTG